MLKTAVLFLVFNRPDVTAKCFEAIRAARPARLYVAADGPRADRLGEAERCEQVRMISTSVDWPCEVKTLFRSENLGCRRAVSGAIDWFFESEPEGVVLEDDCLASPDWFRFAEEMLERYRDDERIMCVSASHFHGAVHTPEHSYFFSRYNHCWGWASWRRAWALYDSDMSAWPALRNGEWLLSIGHGSRFFASYWRAMFERVHAEAIDSWAYRWTFSCWAQSGLSILPGRNLVSNIGFDEYATNTGTGNALEGATPLESLDFPLRHPGQVVTDVAADNWTDRNVYGISLATWLRRSFGGLVRRMMRQG
ncbi:MAG: glycosyltransferase family 2 protein [Azoarcus sp.]